MNGAITLLARYAFKAWAENTVALHFSDCEDQVTILKLLKHFVELLQLRLLCIASCCSFYQADMQCTCV